MINPITAVKKWLVGKMLKKVIKRGVQLFIAWATGLGLVKYGIDLNPEALTASVYLGLEGLRNFLKVKYPKVFGWL